MRRSAGGLTLAGLVAVAVASCSEMSPTAITPDDIAVQANTSAADCALIAPLTLAVRDYFAPPNHQAPRRTMADLESACSSGQQATINALAIELLDMVESALNAGRRGDPARGVVVVTHLLGCIDSRCHTAGVLDTQQLLGALTSEYGLFAIRRGNTKDGVTARGRQPFNIHGVANQALWGILVAENWTNVATVKGNIILLFGAPTSTRPANAFAPGFGLGKWPTDAFKKTGSLHVWACFDREQPFEPAGHPQPHAHGRLLRNSSLISLFELTDAFCNATTPGSLPVLQPTTLSASLFANVPALVRSVLPAGLFAAAYMTDAGTRHVGGSPRDFSEFLPTAAVTAVSLNMTSGPPAVVKRTQTFGGVVVRVMTPVRPGSTDVALPIEDVEVTLSVENNSGTPAGAILLGTRSAITDADGFARFDDLRIDKNGGYIICATADLNGYEFERTCSTLFHVRN